MTGDFIAVDEPTEDGVVVLTLNRPEKRNALSIAVRDEMSDALDALASRDDVKVVIVTGAGETFCAGFDLKEFDRLGEPEFANQLWASSDRFHRVVLSFPLPTVAAVNGPALGGGFDLAVMCDVRIAVPGARFAHPEVAFTEVVYGPLHDLVGGAVARDVALTGRSIDADEALALHLVSRVVPPDSLLDEARSVATSMAVASRDVLLRMKQKIIRRAAVTTGPTLDL